MANPTPAELDASAYDTDKSAEYLRNYYNWLAPLAGKDVRLFELGIKRGGSLKLWRDYFPNGTIAGLDIAPVSIDDATGRIKTYQGRQEDTALLDRIRKEAAPDGFDIVIDDCAHYGDLARITFWHVFAHHLKSGGIYVIEDWGTGYWNSWPDGKACSAAHRYLPPQGVDGSASMFRVKRSGSLYEGVWRQLQIRLKCGARMPSHDFGMVGFVKQLVDECAAADLTRDKDGIPPTRQSRFAKMHISSGQVMIAKR